MKNKLLFVFGITCLCAFPQNVAINATGAAPVASAMLDITSTTSGLLMPRMTSVQRVAIASPATGLKVYDTTTGSFWYFNGVIWVEQLGTNNGWALAGNSLAGTELLGSTNAQPVRLYSNNIERMRILSTGQVAVNSTATFGVSTFYSFATGNNDAVDGNAAGNGASIYGQNTGTGLGVQGLSTNATGFGVWGTNTNASGTGVVGAGNNAASNYLAAGSGGAFNGFNYGLVAKNTNFAASTQQASILCWDGGNNQLLVDAWSTLNTHYKIWGGAWTVSACLPDLDGKKVTLHCPETPEVYIQDYGEGKLVNGKAHITIDPILSKNGIVVNDKHPLRVFIQLEGDCNGVYVTNKTINGFDVIELKGGNSNTPFQWSITCNVKDQLENGRVNHLQDLRFEPGPIIETPAEPKNPAKEK